MRTRGGGTSCAGVCACARSRSVESTNRVIRIGPIVGHLVGHALACQRPLAGAVLACRFLTLRSEEHTSELQSLRHLVCRLLLEKKKNYVTHDTSHMAQFRSCETTDDLPSL